MANPEKKHSYNSVTAGTAAPSIGTDRLLRYLPKKQPEARQVTIEIPETDSSQTANQDILNAVERGSLHFTNTDYNKHFMTGPKGNSECCLPNS